MPAEWEPHRATWIGWPHKKSDWPGKFAAIPWVYGEIVRRLAPGEVVRILVQSAGHERQARRVLERAGADVTRVGFFRFPTDRGWTRDFGPIFVRRDPPRRGLAIVRFGFNGWARYPDWRADARVAERAARALKLRLFRARVAGREFVLEGGAVDPNGRGALLATEECLLDPEVQVRNPGLSRSETESALREHLGVEQIVWLPRGIAGDDTHGHVDDCARFVGPRTVVACRAPPGDEANHRALEENWERLSEAHLADGSKLELVALPMPAPLCFDGRRLPASYANFYVGNECVLVPTFNDVSDRVAIGTLSDLFPGRKVTGLHAVDLVWGLGTIHCLTQQEPLA
jgi:agmatine deiminase